MKNLLLILLICFAFASCDNNTDDNNTDRDTTVIIHENRDAEQEQETTKEPEKAVRDWKPLMTEYHRILCRQHKNQGTTNDKIRQVELAKELEEIRRELDDDQKFTFTADMAKAMNMEDC